MGILDHEVDVGPIEGVLREEHTIGRIAALQQNLGIGREGDAIAGDLPLIGGNLWVL